MLDCAANAESELTMSRAKTTATVAPDWPAGLSPAAAQTALTGADDPRLSVEWQADDGGVLKARSWQHADLPFTAWLDARTWGDDPARVPDTLYQTLAGHYLDWLPDTVGPGAAVLAALRINDGPFGWLALGWGDAAIAPELLDPLGSYWLQRRGMPAGAEAQRCLVLLAARRLLGHAIGDDTGLRLLLQLDRPETAGQADRPLRIRIRGGTGSRLHQATALAALPAPWRWQHRPDALHYFSALNQRIAQTLRVKWAAVLKATSEGLAGTDALRLSGVAGRERGVDSGPPARARIYSFVVDIDAAGQIHHRLALEELSASAARLWLFERDPASCGPAATLTRRRPSRDEATLDAFRHNLDHALMATGQQHAALALARQDKFEVWGVQPRGSTAVTLATVGSGRITATLKPGTTLPLRSDRLAAAQAHLRASELFDRLEAYGFSAEHYFRQARLPLVLRPRAAMRGAPAGDGVNAEVRPFWVDALPGDCLLGRGNGPGAAARELRPQLQVKFGSAEPQVRQRLPVVGGKRRSALSGKRQRAQYLGLAADPRWAWHEFGHVLNYAATGVLELPFAHSAGDALAAIACDPDSALAWDAHARGQTFPWVQVPRRHDRPALQGWCWCGQRNRLRLARGAPPGPHRFGYFEEQLLSSSLFRLYRCLGGDTRAADRAPREPNPVDDADLPARQAAADYAIYLVMHATALLGPDSISPARSAEQYVQALVDADLATGLWQPQARWPLRQVVPRQLSRPGGVAHKLVRWAFEQQGLYACADGDPGTEGVGQPPPVDIFIADRRRGGPYRQPPPPDGGYHPVPLRWQAEAAPWHADPAHLALQGDQVQLQIGNRGHRVAEQVQAGLWWCPAQTDPAAPLPWQRLDSGPGLAKRAAVPAAGLAAPAFARFSLPLDTALAQKATQQGGWLLAQVQALGDAANLGPDQPPPSASTDLLALVSGDNNLGLLRLPTSPVGGQA